MDELKLIVLLHLVGCFHNHENNCTFKYVTDPDSAICS